MAENQQISLPMRKQFLLMLNRKKLYIFGIYSFVLALTACTRVKEVREMY